MQPEHFSENVKEIVQPWNCLIIFLNKTSQFHIV